MRTCKLALGSALALAVSLGAAGGASGETLLERGTYLMRGVVACGNCHTPKNRGNPDTSRELAGGNVFDEKPFTAYSANITPDKETGIGSWTDAQIIRAIREGKRPDGSIIGPPMPVGLYRGLSDRDVKAIVAYLRSVKPMKNKVPKSVYRIPLPKAYGPPVKSVAEVSRSDKVRYGKYLVGPLGHCIVCHTPMIKGRRDYKNQLAAGGFRFDGPWGASSSGRPIGRGENRRGASPNRRGASPNRRGRPQPAGPAPTGGGPPPPGLFLSSREDIPCARSDSSTSARRWRTAPMSPAPPR